MLLQELKLNNIRSYVDETITFSKGSTLLSGDIGSGKSTILFGIEFALFGTSRPDLPAELLLRKGSKEGSVELKLELDGRNITIRRNLKRDKNSIKQMSGHIIINNTKKELMPIEMKAEMIALLGYPEELVTKNKNPIFRYTIYTPQEEMKFILQENSDIRLDVLRKIFNIDKYKIIRENTDKFLRKMRTNIAIYKTKTEPLPEEEEKLKTLKDLKEKKEQEIKEIEPLHFQLNEELRKEQEVINLFEQQQKNFLELKHEHNTRMILINEKKENQKKFNERLQSLKEELSQLFLPENKNEQEIKQELKHIEEQKISLLNKKTTLQEKINNLQTNIQNLHEEINLLDTTKIEEKKLLKDKLSLEILNKEEFEKKKSELENFLQKTSSLIIQNKTLLSQSKEMQEKILSLENCPTCRQLVPHEHKNNLINHEQEKNLKAEEILKELQEKEVQISVQKKNTDIDLQIISEKENLLKITNLEIAQLEEKEEERNRKKDFLKTLIKENNGLIQEQEIINGEDVDQFNQKISQMQEMINIFSKKEILEKNYLQLSSQIEEVSKEILEIDQKISTIENDLVNKEDLTEKIQLKRINYQELHQREKEKAISLATSRTQHENLTENILESHQVINNLNLQKNKLIRLKELHHWLDEHFLKLTYAIEKQVMVNIHNHFNQIFQEWFSMLIDDNEISSRIDDTFTPIIQQNGYEISFTNLSGGEKTSAALAYRLALNKVINDVINGIRTKDLLILDEPTDGFSTEQLDKVRDVLEKLQLKQTIIVSHESKIESFVENIIRISKNGHESKIVT